MPQHYRLLDTLVINQPRSQGLSSYRLLERETVRWETLGMRLVINTNHDPRAKARNTHDVLDEMQYRNQKILVPVWLCLWFLVRERFLKMLGLRSKRSRTKNFSAFWLRTTPCFVEFLFSLQFRRGLNAEKLFVGERLLSRLKMPRG